MASSVVDVVQKIVDVDYKLRDTWGWVLCEVASGGVGRLVEFNIRG